MSNEDVNTELDAGAAAGTDPEMVSTIISVPIVKGKADIQIDTNLIPDEVYREIVLQGLKVILNRGMSKITTTGLTGKALEDAQAAAMAKAAENVEAVKTGNIKFTGKSAKKSKVSGAVNTEAMRIARNLVKDAMKAAGTKISHVKASEITKAAKQLIEADQSIIAQAEAEIEKRSKTKISINVAAIKVDPELVAKAEAKAKADKANRPLSAKQAGKAATRSKGKGAGASASA